MPDDDVELRNQLGNTNIFAGASTKNIFASPRRRLLLLLLKGKQLNLQHIFKGIVYKNQDIYAVISLGNLTTL